MSSESEVFIGYTDGASRHTQRLASAAWVIFSPRGQLLSSGGIFLGDTTNNVMSIVQLLSFFMTPCHLVSLISGSISMLSWLCLS
jgi:hypothetical protein